MSTVTAGILCLQFNTTVGVDDLNGSAEVDRVLAEINDIIRQAMPDEQPQFTRHIIYPTQIVVEPSQEEDHANP